ncbi:MAG TPA: AEC family transporter [Burkholderiaceae bacterium]|nr:AEC family transporter [Burkholderiaceae bacterium]
MSLVIFLKLVAIFSIVAIGFIADRARWLGEGDVARVLSNAAFYLFVPALLFRTTARIDLHALPWRTLAAFFVPVVGCLLAVYFAGRRTQQTAGRAAAPSVRALSVSFGNTVQLGIPMVTALYGVEGLAVHLAIVSLHALTLLTVATTLVELDLARARAAHRGVEQTLARTLATTVRNTVIHPVVLPVLAGLLFNLAGFRIPAFADETLVLLAQAVVPVCLVVIGMSLAHYGVRGALRGAVWLSAAKLLLLPALVLVAGHWVAGLDGMPLAVIVLCAALPVGSNALLFAQRYETLEHEATAAIVISTFAFVVSAPLWLAVVGWIG